MAAIAPCPLPEGSLLAAHSRGGDHTDCYAAEVPGAVGLAGLVEAFYTSRGFLPERLLLTLIRRGGSAEDARRLARAETDRFAAWRVEARSEHELLLRDTLGRTRSWLRAEPLPGGGTRLWFGSGVVRRERRGGGGRIGRTLFRALLPLHAVYSRVLLGAAVRGLQAKARDS